MDSERRRGDTKEHWISTNSGCFAASNAIARTSLALNKFVREVRESRSELDSISTELHSLEGVLELLRDDAASFPPLLAEQTPGVLDSCLNLINELEGCISVLNRPGVSKADKKSRWLASRDHISKLQWTLGRYKMALGLAVDLIGATKSAENDAGEYNDPEEKSEVEAVTERILNIADRMHVELRQNRALAKLELYFETLREHATAASIPPQHQQDAQQERDAFPPRIESRNAMSPVGDPDSAIEMSYDDSQKAFKPQLAPITTSFIDDAFDEMDEFSGELNEMPAHPVRDVRTRAPPPPPRSLARLSQQMPNFSRRPSAPESLYYGSGSNSGESDMASRSSMSNSMSHTDPHLSGWSYNSPPPSVGPPSSARENKYYSGMTDHSHSSHSDSHSYRSGDSRPPSLNQQPQSSRFSVFENPREIPTPSIPSFREGPYRPSSHATTMSKSSLVMSPPMSPVSSGKRSTSRLGSAFSRLGLGRSSSKAPDSPSIPEAEPTDVFSVPLAVSMRVAKGVASTNHDNGGSSGRRDYPLCVLRCVYHIREVGIEVPHLFGQDGDVFRVGDLKDIFNSPTTGYGKQLDWSDFTVHDAADLILLYLSELPKALIPDSLAKRWAKLSKQATVSSGGLAMRLDQGIDFWEEALMGIKGPERALFKLLLSLWADIAEFSGENQMTAERLAERVLRPLLHTIKGEKGETDFMLGLAFMIRKRSEYNVKMRNGGKSRAAF
ncbi:putative GTPase-activating protein [Cladorrhinum sp. PSN332]|nr:putative GTPase-activating protein [Cladorrhinum sp. PSN332]